MRFFRPWFFAHWLYPEAIFRVRTKEKAIFLTFDDGPDPDSTPLLLEILRKHEIKAIFFCNGETASRYPGIIESIKEEGHLLGNHGKSHYDGWKTPLNEYLENADSANIHVSTNYFRPPYGRLKVGQYLKLKSRYKIVFWDVMPYDFDDSFGSDSSLRVLKKLIRPGSVVVLHDNFRSCLHDFINEFILYAKWQGYVFSNQICK